MPSRKRECARALLAAGAIFLVVSCATAPRTARSAAEYLDLLPSPQTAYLSVDLERIRDIVPGIVERMGVPRKEIDGSASRARLLLAGLLLSPGLRPQFCAVAVGQFPPAAVRASLALKRGWRRVSGAGAVWYENVELAVQVAALEPGLLLAANGRMEELIGSLREPRRLEVPPEVAAAMEDSDLVLYFPSVPTVVQLGSATQPPPVEQLWIAATVASDSSIVPDAMDTPLDIELSLVLSGEREARLFRPVLRLLLLGMARQGQLPGGTAALSTIRDEQDGRMIRLRGMHMSVSEALAVAGRLTGQPEGAAAAPMGSSDG